LEIERKVRQVLDSTLALGGRAREFDANTPLLGALPELDSMAVAYLITALEEQVGISIADDEIDGAVFATFGTLVRFVQRLHDEQAERVPG
jgi:acyl carrier protein